MIQPKQNYGISSKSQIPTDPSLVVRGQMPSQTQHQSYLLNGSFEKFITVHDQNQGSHDGEVHTMPMNSISLHNSNHDLQHVDIKLMKAP